jgi:ribonucleoside-triphosphate reductase
MSSPLRLQILNLLFDEGPLSYTELMNALKMNPSRDAGRFAYHLKFLLKTDLIETDVEAKKYCLTELGKMVIDVAEKIEKRTLKKKKTLVRTSRFTLEEFDANKIADSLIKEAKMPSDLAQKIAKEAEKRLLKSKTKYLTTPLVREVVNAILIEWGLEEYRHRLTRLGLPVYDVTTLIEIKSKNLQGSASIQEMAGETVLKEYTLLNVLPRDIADAHLSGSLHINDLKHWILKPSEIMHDLRFFFKNGLNLEKINVLHLSYPPPKNLNSALSMILNILLHSSKEVGETQTLDYFNVFLAPFLENAKPDEIKEALRLFILNIGQHRNTSLGLELTIPDFMTDKEALGPDGRIIGKYEDFIEKSQLLASLILEIIAEESANKPVLNPKVVLKIRPEVFLNDALRVMLLKAHAIASERGIFYFANLFGKNQKYSVFSVSGFRLNTDPEGDWEIDTLRSGCLGCVTVNMPRIAYESGKERTKFFEILGERLEMAARALEIKDRSLKYHGKGLLPFLTQTANGDKYFRFEKAPCIINFVGLREAVEVFSGDTATFIEEVVQNTNALIRKYGKRLEKCLLPAMLPSFEASKRLAQLDIERYGAAKVQFSGTKEKPFYSTEGKLTFKNGKIQQDYLTFKQKTRSLQSGGSLTVIELGENECEPDELVMLTKELFNGNNVEFFTYTRNLTYCKNCKKSWFGILHKCPSCGAVDTLTFYERVSPFNITK